MAHTGEKTKVTISATNAIVFCSDEPFHLSRMIPRARISGEQQAVVTTVVPAARWHVLPGKHQLWSWQPQIQEKLQNNRYIPGFCFYVLHSNKLSDPVLNTMWLDNNALFGNRSVKLLCLRGSWKWRPTSELVLEQVWVHWAKAALGVQA